MYNRLSYCGLVDPRISASEKDLPVHLEYFFQKIKKHIYMFANWVVDGAQYIFIKTICTTRKISQTSGYQNRKKIKLPYFYLSELIKKTQFAMTDPLICSTTYY